MPLVGLIWDCYCKRSLLPLVPKVDTEGSPQPSHAVSLAMLDSNAKPERSWHDIVAEIAMATRCHNRERIADLRKELDSVLDHRSEALRAKAITDKNLPQQRKTA